MHGSAARSWPRRWRSASSRSTRIHVGAALVPPPSLSIDPASAPPTISPVLPRAVQYENVTQQDSMAGELTSLKAFLGLDPALPSSQLPLTNYKHVHTGHGPDAVRGGGQCVCRCGRKQCRLARRNGRRCMVARGHHSVSHVLCVRQCPPPLPPPPPISLATAGPVLGNEALGAGAPCVYRTEQHARVSRSRSVGGSHVSHQKMSAAAACSGAGRGTGKQGT